MIVADDVVIADAATAVMIGAGVAVVNVKFADVVVAPAAFVDRTSALYRVEAVRFVSVTECDVTSELFSVDCDP